MICKIPHLRWRLIQLNEETREEIKALIAKFEQMHQQKEQQKSDKELIKNLVYSINDYLEEKPMYVKITFFIVGICIGCFLGSLV